MKKLLLLLLATSLFMLLGFTPKLDLPSDYLKEAVSKYAEVVYDCSARFNVDADIVFAIIHTESYFNPYAKSPVPAFGLMQLVPNTQARDAYRYAYNEDVIPSEEDLYNPEMNIFLGTAYLGKLQHVYFKGVTNKESLNIICIAAYNAGLGTVAKALTGEASLKNVANVVNGMTSVEVYTTLLENVPYEESKVYLKHVIKRSAMYRGK